MTTWNWTILRAGAFRLDGGGMFGVVPKALWSRMTEPDDANRIGLQTNCLLLEDGSTRVLIETGYGDKWSEKERGIYALEPRTVVDALREHGVDAESIDHVIVTHLHFDHAGGLTGGPDAAPCFPNARVHCQRREWEDACANRAVMTRTYLRNHLDPVAAAVELHDGDDEVLPGIHVDPAPGHTWGQHLIRFADGKGTLAFPGDVMPTVHHVGPAFNMGYDIEPYTNMQTKQTLLERAARESWRLILDHEPGDPVVRVAQDGDRFRLESAGAS